MLQRRHFDLFSQLLADRQSGSTNGADQIPAVRQLSHLQCIAEPQIPQPVTVRTLNELNTKIAFNARLAHGLRAVGLQLSDVGFRHFKKLTANETRLQKGGEQRTLFATL